MAHQTSTTVAEHSLSLDEPPHVPHSEPLSSSTGSIDSGSSEKENSAAVAKGSAQHSIASSFKTEHDTNSSGCALTSPPSNGNEQSARSKHASLDSDSNSASAKEIVGMEPSSNPNSTMEAGNVDPPIVSPLLEAAVAGVVDSSLNEQVTNGDTLERYDPEQVHSIDPPESNTGNGSAIEIHGSLQHVPNRVEEDVVVEIEIEEEDLDTLAREMEPEAVQAILENNGVEEVRLDRSSATVSGLTELEESTSSPSLEKFSPPPMPLQSALTDRFHSDSTDMTNGELMALERADFKCQTRDDVVATSVRATPSPVRSNTASGSSEQSDSQIPVAAAVLVPEEPEQNRNVASLVPDDDSGRYGSGGRSNSNTTTWLESDETKRERNFWITAIGIALCLNSILVGGVVVAGFCLAGKCRSEPPSGHATTIDFSPTVAPGNRIFGTFPTAAPTTEMLPPMGAPPNFSDPMVLAPSPIPPTISPFPTFPIVDNIPVGTTAAFPPPLPNIPVDSASGTTIVDAASEATTVPFTGSITVVTPPFPEGEIDLSNADFGPNMMTPPPVTVDPVVDAVDDTWDEAESGEVPFLALFAVAAIVEAFICGGLCLYYRLVKRRRKDDDTTAVEAAASSSEEPGQRRSLEDVI